MLFRSDTFAMIRVGATDFWRTFGARHRVQAGPNRSEPGRSQETAGAAGERPGVIIRGINRIKAASQANGGGSQRRLAAVHSIVVRRMWEQQAGVFFLMDQTANTNLFIIRALAAFANLVGWCYLSGLFAVDRKSTRLNSSHVSESRMPSSA